MTKTEDPGYRRRLTCDAREDISRADAIGEAHRREGVPEPASVQEMRRHAGDLRAVLAEVDRLRGVCDRMREWARTVRPLAASGSTYYAEAINDAADAVLAVLARAEEKAAASDSTPAGV